MSGFDPLAEALHMEKRRQRNGSLAKFSKNITQKKHGNSLRQNNGITTEDAAAISQSLSRKKRKSQLETKFSCDLSSTTPKRKGPCSFCGMESAAVSVKRSLTTIELCLLHYYTTSAILMNNVTIYNKAAFREQLPYVQSLFERSIAELLPMLTSEQMSQTKREKRTKVQHTNDTVETSLQASMKCTSSTTNVQKTLLDTHDPLSSLLKKNKKKSMDKPKVNLSREGGFIRSADASETERQLMHQHALVSSSGRKCIWNLAMDKSIISSPVIKKDNIVRTFNNDIKCSCGSAKVECLGNVSCRNNDVPKAETWGIKRDADSITTRYRCLSCAKVWNQEE